MIVTFVSLCEKRSIKKTIQVLDRYAPRIGKGVWQTPITMEALKEVYAALKSTSSKTTSVACYRNAGYNRQQLMWIVGSNRHYGNEGSIAVSSTLRSKKRPLPLWINMATLCATLAGIQHDVGKATKHFQRKLRDKKQNNQSDYIRHEWISLKVFEHWRDNMRSWEQDGQVGEMPKMLEAWLELSHENETSHKSLLCLPKIIQSKRERIGNQKVNVVNPISNADAVVDLAILTHHGLLGPAKAETEHPMPDSSAHVRQEKKTPEQDLSVYFPESIKKPVLGKDHEKRAWSLIRRIRQKADEMDVTDYYWKGMALLVRVALIAADHQVSSRWMPEGEKKKPKDGCYANTKITGKNKNTTRVLDQTLEYHLTTVGLEAGRWINRLAVMGDLDGVTNFSRDNIRADVTNPRYRWQQSAVDHLRHITETSKGEPRLIINTASTGTGKTRGNIMMSEAMTPSCRPFRVSIGLNLRTLTLQTGDAIINSVGIDSSDVTTVIGDTYLMDAHKALEGANKLEKEIENEDGEYEDDTVWDVGEFINRDCPLWLEQWCNVSKTPSKTKSIICSPVLVSTVDYLIDAGNPGRQGHHVNACLRSASADLILDEVDNYSPKSLGAILRLVEMTALFGRNVIISSATMSMSCSMSIVEAFHNGARMHAEMNRYKWDGACVTFIDHHHDPLSIKGDNIVIRTSLTQRLNDLAHYLLTEPVYRLAYIQDIQTDGTPEKRFNNSILDAVNKLHSNHGWTHPSGKRVSFGVVRVANVSTCVSVARFLQAHAGIKVTAYHADEFRIRRWIKEIKLDRLMQRHNGNQNIIEDAEIDDEIASIDSDDVKFIVVATPVEEVGRDHDFDWGVIEPSSAASIVQMAGRVNRHRKMSVDQANIAILDVNLRSLNGQSKCFLHPGNGKSYPSPDKQTMNVLLAGSSAWNLNGLMVTPEIVFGINGQRAVLANDDDARVCEILNAIKKEIVISDEKTNGSDHALSWITKEHYEKYRLRENKERSLKFRYCTNDYGDWFFKAYSPISSNYTDIKGSEWHETNSIQVAVNDGYGVWTMLTPKLEDMHEIALAYGLNPLVSSEISLHLYSSSEGFFKIDSLFGRM